MSYYEWQHENDLTFSHHSLPHLIKYKGKKFRVQKQKQKVFKNKKEWFLICYINCFNSSCFELRSSKTKDCFFDPGSSKTKENYFSVI